MDLNQQYDVAISFLAQDEPLALHLKQKLSPNVSVFVYSERQKELVGKDGLEEFSQVFGVKARVAVVLYRDGWGDTKWTAVEELAIKGRTFRDGLRSLVFATLTEKFTLPEWLPEHFIRLEYTRFPDDLAPAVRRCVLERGGELREETSLSKARRIKDAEVAEHERGGKLSYESRTAVPSEWNSIGESFTAKLAELNQYLQVESGFKNLVLVGRTSRASVVAELTPYHSEESKLHVVLFNGRRILPDETQRMYIPGLQPEPISDYGFQIDYDAARGWFWRSLDSKTESPTSEGMAEFLASKLIDAHRQVESGVIRPKQFNFKPPHARLRRR